jgi:hypothetical protein
MLTDWFIYQIEKRQSAEDDDKYLASTPRNEPVIPHCLRCGAAKEDAASHVCGPTHSQMRRASETRLYRQQEKERAAEVVLTIGGVRREVR